MKTHEITTSKGEFVVVDYNYNTHRQDLYSLDIDILERVGYINNITEEQASDIVDEDNEYGVTMYRNYATTSMAYYDEQLTALESLHALLKSKGIEVNKGNWYLFKKI